MRFVNIKSMITLIFIFLMVAGALATAPVVLDVNSTTPDGNYGLGRDVNVLVVFDQPVYLYTGTTDNVRLDMNVYNAGGYATATMVDGNGTNYIRFVVTVASNYSTPDLTYIAATPLYLTGGAALKNLGQEDANLVLATPNAAHSLAANAAILIDGGIPTFAAKNTFGNVRTAPSAEVLYIGYDQNVRFQLDTVAFGVSNTRFAQAKLDSGAFANLTAAGSNWSIDYDVNSAAMYDGNHLVTFFLRDGAGNDKNGTISFLVDKTAPSTTIDFSTTTWLTSRPTITLTCADTNSGCYAIVYDLNAGTTNFAILGGGSTAQILPGNSSWGLDGNYAVKYYSIDKADTNNVETSHTFYVAIDGNAPTHSFVDNNFTAYTSAVVRLVDFNVVVKDANFGVSDMNTTATYYTFDGGAAQTFAAGYAVNLGAQDYNLYIPVTDGNHVINIRLVDKAGNVKDINGIRAAKDKVDPTVTVNAIVDKSTTTATLPITVSEPATCRYVQGVANASYDAMSAATSATFTWGALTGNLPQIAELTQDHTYTYTVTCRDFNGNDGNSVVTFTTNASGGSGSSGSSGSSSGGSSSTPVPGTSTSTETLTVTTTTPTAAEVTDALANSGLSASDIQAYADAASNGTLAATVTVDVEKTVTNGITTYKSTFHVTFKNTSGKDMKDVSIVQVIPKNIAQNASEITSLTQFKVLVADPILEFSVPTIAAGSSATINYSVNGQVTQAEFAAMDAPVAKGTEVTPTVPPTNEGSNPTTGTTTGTTTPATGTETTTQTGTDNMIPIIVIALVIVIIIGYVVMNQKKKK